MNVNTPEELMRSRYDAFIREDWQYIANTSINQTIEELSTSPSLTWLKLDVIKAYDNVVEFKAYYKHENIIEVLHEKSTFIRVDNVWKYQDGTLYPSKINSNDLCPCGSGKKFKKCCS
ncbi:MAG: SEC-C motif-containing protein [Sulfurimonas sp.]|jgi:SEC-C motif-containing protein|uniref:YchJ family protein n=1 Tax=Sulfurimonas sp. TaxID=2022749 RepID=UPI0039E707E2